MKLPKGSHCPLVQMIIVRSALCLDCEHFKGYDADWVECAYEMNGASLKITEAKR